MSHSMQFWLSFYLLFMLLTVFVGYWKNNVVAGFLLGYVFGPVGLIILLFSHDRRHKKCTYCSFTVNHHTYHCPRCGKKCYRILSKATNG